jgi:hypothetical protein
MEISIKMIAIIKSLNDIPTKDKEFLFELLEHDEWGVALETLCAIVNEEGISISQDVYRKMVELGEYMQMDSATWKGLDKLIQTN